MKTILKNLALKAILKNLAIAQATSDIYASYIPFKLQQTYIKTLYMPRKSI